MATFTKKQKFVEGIINTYGLECDRFSEDNTTEGTKDEANGPTDKHESSNSQFLKAMLVMKKVSADGQPGVIRCSNGHDFLCIGSVGAAYNLPALQALNITHILCMADVCRIQFPEHFVYKKVTCRDTLGNDNQLM
jgi:hypothetical protein